MGKKVNRLYFWFRTMFGENLAWNFSMSFVSVKYIYDDMLRAPGGLNGTVLDLSFTDEVFSSGTFVYACQYASFERQRTTHLRIHRRVICYQFPPLVMLLLIVLCA